MKALWAFEHVLFVWILSLRDSRWTINVFWVKWIWLEWSEFNLHSGSTTYHWEIYLISQCLRFLYSLANGNKIPTYKYGNEILCMWSVLPHSGHRVLSHWAAAPTFTHLSVYLSRITVPLKTRPQNRRRNQETEGKANIRGVPFVCLAFSLIFYVLFPRLFVPRWVSDWLDDYV